jgi:hypothetical protein
MGSLRKAHRGDARRDREQPARGLGPGRRPEQNRGGAPVGALVGTWRVFFRTRSCADKLGSLRSAHRGDSTRARLDPAGNRPSHRFAGQDRGGAPLGAPAGDRRFCFRATGCVAEMGSLRSAHRGIRGGLVLARCCFGDGEGPTTGRVAPGAIGSVRRPVRRRELGAFVAQQGIAPTKWVRPVVAHRERAGRSPSGSIGRLAAFPGRRPGADRSAHPARRTRRSGLVPPPRSIVHRPSFPGRRTPNAPGHRRALP